MEKINVIIPIGLGWDAEAVQNLEKQKEDASKEKVSELDANITKYQEELDRIQKLFPDNFFEELN